MKIGTIVGSIRRNRFADTPAKWLLDGTAARTDLKLEALDLREYKLPFFNEPAPPAYTGGVFSEPQAEAWRKHIGEFDGFIATVAEHNHGPTAVQRTLLTARPSNGNASPSLLLATVALARPERLRPCGAWQSNYRWRRSSRK
jgi:NAD(P)H-dependent FMN reductase